MRMFSLPKQPIFNLLLRVLHNFSAKSDADNLDSLAQNPLNVTVSGRNETYI